MEMSLPYISPRFHSGFSRPIRHAECYRLAEEFLLQLQHEVITVFRQTLMGQETQDTELECPRRALSVDEGKRFLPLH